MANRTLTVDMIASEALAILEANLGILKRLHRGYEDEFTEKHNGYAIGSSVDIRRPSDYRIRDGAVMQLQESIEGKINLPISKMKGVDLSFSSQEMTLEMGGEEGFSKRCLQPAMVSLVHEVAADVFETMYKGLWDWAGTAGEVINSAADFMQGPQRLNHKMTPLEQRTAMLSVDDHAALIGSQTALYINEAAKAAYRDAELGRLLGTETYMSQVTPTHTCGTRTNTTPAVDGAGQVSLYSAVKDTMQQSLLLKAAGNAVTYLEGDVFTIANVYMVNARTKRTLPVLQNFRVVTSDVTSAGGALSLTIEPAIIVSGPHQNCNAAPADGALITNIGAAGSVHAQNMVFHKDAMAVAFVPLILPPGAVNPTRKSYKGMSVRLIPIYDGTNDNSSWRLDVLYGRKVINGNLGTRLSGKS